jgi:hypothetical protein
MIQAFSTLSLQASDGNTVPSIEFLNTRTYVDIGSGTVLKLSWDTPTATENAVDYYKLYIAAYNAITDTYQIVLDGSIGNVNEFYVTSELLSNIDFAQYHLNIQLTAFSRYGNEYNGISELIAVNISRGCGTYIKVTDGYAQPIMKRSVACAKLDYLPLTDSTGKQIYDADGEALYIKVSKAQSDSDGWTLMSDFYSKDSSNNWHLSDIQYEVLTDANGEIITDSNNEPIYTL